MAPKSKSKSKKPATPPESHLLLTSPQSTPIIDTHTHLLSTFSAYKGKYPTGRYDSIWDFVRGVYHDRNVAAIVDVWCEAPVVPVWREVADSAVREDDRTERWGGVEYWFVMGVHPHDAKLYDDAVEKSILEAMTHPRCVGWGEIGLDYHYDNSPRSIQQDVFTRQLRAAVSLGKPLTIHTREAEDDTEKILKAEVPVDHKIHVHCFTDSPEFGRRLLAHFPNLYVGITGVITYATNMNTTALVRHMFASASTGMVGEPSPPRILLETDAPFMVPSNIYSSLPEVKGRLPLCHSGMIPWTGEFVAGVVGDEWGAAEVMGLANKNARAVYGV